MILPTLIFHLFNQIFFSENSFQFYFFFIFSMFYNILFGYVMSDFSVYNLPSLFLFLFICIIYNFLTIFYS